MAELRAAGRGKQSALPATALALAVLACLPACAASGPRSTEAYRRIDDDIVMRDGVSLHTVILIPSGARADRLPMLLTRTPYGADAIAAGMDAADADLPFDAWNRRMTGGSYIRVLQDIRGLGRSGGRFVVTRPLAGTPFNRTRTDEATDAYDTVDWLVRHVARSDGRVGLIGTSYDGFTALMGLIGAHPAIRVAVAVNPMVDGWRGDDWFRNGAFRQKMLAPIWSEGTRDPDSFRWGPHPDTALLRAGSVGAFASGRGMDRIPFWRSIVAHPAYDRFWQSQALDRLLAAHPPAVPLMLVHGLWDQDDIYGALAVWRALRPARNVYLTIGPWRHAQALGEGRAVGGYAWGGDTAAAWRAGVLAPFLMDALADRRSEVARVTAYRSGSGWMRLPDWPPCAAPAMLYLRAGRRLAFGAAAPAARAIESYVSDPARPVPSAPAGPPEDWLAANQRFAARRRDVLTFTSPPLRTAITIAGTPVAHLLAATSGSDADWVVKLVDVRPGRAGAMLPVSMTILRGRYRLSLSRARRVQPGRFLSYRIAMPEVSHVFARRHRIAVQVQSSWFPAYDRNPQRFVPSIFAAKRSDYRRAVQRIAVGGVRGSRIALPFASPGFGLAPSQGGRPCAGGPSRPFERGGS